MFQFKLRKEFEGFALDVEFEANPNEILIILGRSGSGKSTLLNLISGLHQSDQGYIRGNGRTYLDVTEQVFMPIHQRNFGYIQQKSNLFPHLTTYENIIYGMKKKIEQQRQLDLQYYIQVFGLENHLNKYPEELSGGQQQRVAIIRALMASPDLLLFDEPFSALDNVLRTKLREKILELKEKINIPIIFVTHDLEEAYLMGDRIILLDQGKIVEYEEKKKFFHQPTKESTARFIGINNILSAEYLPLREMVALNPENRVAIRPNKMKIIPPNSASPRLTSKKNILDGEITNVFAFNHYTKVIINLVPSGQKLEVHCSDELEELGKNIQRGMAVQIMIDGEDLIVLEE